MEIYREFGMQLAMLREQARELMRITHWRWPKHHRVNDRLERWDKYMWQVTSMLDDQVGEDGVYICFSEEDRELLKQSRQPIHSVFEQFTVHHRTRPLKHALFPEEYAVYLAVMASNQSVLERANVLWFEGVLTGKVYAILTRWDQVTSQIQMEVPTPDI